MLLGRKGVNQAAWKERAKEQLPEAVAAGQLRDRGLW